MMLVSAPNEIYLSILYYFELGFNYYKGLTTIKALTTIKLYV